jgi:hypothetical protein
LVHLSVSNRLARDYSGELRSRTGGRKFNGDLAAAILQGTGMVLPSLGRTFPTTICRQNGQAGEEYTSAIPSLCTFPSGKAIVYLFFQKI